MTPCSMDAPREKPDELWLGHRKQCRVVVTHLGRARVHRTKEEEETSRSRKQCKERHIGDEVGQTSTSFQVGYTGRL